MKIPRTSILAPTAAAVVLVGGLGVAAAVGGQSSSSPAPALAAATASPASSFGGPGGFDLTALAGGPGGAGPLAGLAGNMMGGGMLGDPAIQGVALKVGTALLADAPAATGPAIDAAVAKNTITQAQADVLRGQIATLSSAGITGVPAFAQYARDADPAVRGVIADTATALAGRAKDVGTPIVDQAVADGTLTAEQGTQAKDALGQAGTLAPRFAQMRERFGRDFGPLHKQLADPQVRQVYEDVTRAVAKQAPAIGAPIIQRARRDGDLTAAQATQVRDTLRTLSRRAASARP